MIKTQRYGDITQFIMGRIMGGQLVYSMACYYVDGLLIDTGPVHVADEIEEAFADYTVDIIINTHHHEDHIGNNIVFQQKLGVRETFAHQLAVPLIKNPSLWISRLRPYQHMAWGEPPASEAIPLEGIITTGQHEFHIIHTPGHSPDHICIFEPRQKWLFSGDLFVRERVPTLRSDEDVTTMLSSLHKILEYDFSTLFCSSGMVVTDGREAVRRKIIYWEDLQGKVRELYQQGLEPDEIRAKLLGKETILYEPTAGDFGKINLVMSFIDGLKK